MGISTPISKRITRSQNSDISDISDNEQILQSISKRRKKSIKPTLDTVSENKHIDNTKRVTPKQTRSKSPNTSSNKTQTPQRYTSRPEHSTDQLLSIDGDISDDYVDIQLEDVSADENDESDEVDNDKHDINKQQPDGISDTESQHDDTNSIHIKHKFIPQYTDTDIQQLQQHKQQQSQSNIDHASDSDDEPEQQITTTVAAPQLPSNKSNKKTKQPRPIAKSKHHKQSDNNDELPDDILQAVSEYDRQHPVHESDHEPHSTATEDKLSHIDSDRLQRILAGDLHSSDDDIDLDTLMAASKRIKGLDVDLSKFTELDNNDGLRIDTTIKSKHNFITDNTVLVDGINVVVNQPAQNKQQALYQFAYESVNNNSDYIERTLYNDRHRRAPLLKKYTKTLYKPNKLFVKR